MYLTVYFSEGKIKRSLVNLSDWKDCDQNGDRMPKNDEKLPFLHWVTKKNFQLAISLDLIKEEALKIELRQEEKLINGYIYSF